MYKEYAQQLTSSIASLAAINKLTAKERTQARTEEIQAGKTPLSKELMRVRTDLAEKAGRARDLTDKTKSEMAAIDDKMVSKASDEDLQVVAQSQLAAEHAQSGAESAFSEGVKQLDETYQGIEDAYVSGKISTKRAMKKLKAGTEGVKKVIHDELDAQMTKYLAGGEVSDEEVATRVSDLRLQAAQREKERMNTARESLTRAGFVLPGGTR